MSPFSFSFIPVNLIWWNGSQFYVFQRLLHSHFISPAQLHSWRPRFYSISSLFFCYSREDFNKSSWILNSDEWLTKTKETSAVVREGKKGERGKVSDKMFINTSLCCSINVGKCVRRLLFRLTISRRDAPTFHSRSDVSPYEEKMMMTTTIFSRRERRSTQQWQQQRLFLDDQIRSVLR